MIKYLTFEFLAQLKTSIIQKLETEVRDFYQTRHEIFAKIYKKIIEVFKYVWVIERPLINNIFIVILAKSMKLWAIT